VTGNLLYFILFFLKPWISSISFLVLFFSPSIQGIEPRALCLLGSTHWALLPDLLFLRQVLTTFAQAGLKLSILLPLPPGVADIVGMYHHTCLCLWISIQGKTVFILSHVLKNRELPRTVLFWRKQIWAPLSSSVARRNPSVINSHHGQYQAIISLRTKLQISCLFNNLEPVWDAPAHLWVLSRLNYFCKMGW
jgi:hypothetical protein